MSKKDIQAAVTDALKVARSNAQRGNLKTLAQNTAFEASKSVHVTPK
ncbi:hypothetical protein [Pseudaestuariivita rosea]|nr:hypothetical protein [Pseudaestuariivita rosea]